MHTGIGSVFSQAHFPKVAEIFAGLPLFGCFGLLAFVILENLLGFPVVYIGALVVLHPIIFFHALYYTRLGLDCQGLLDKNYVLAPLAHARDLVLFLGGRSTPEVGSRATATSADTRSYVSCTVAAPQWS